MTATKFSIFRYVLIASLMMLWTPLTVHAQSAGSVNWEGWTLDYEVSSRYDGMSLSNVSYQGVKVLERASMPVMTVFYENNACGPYADRLGGTGLPVNWAGSSSVVNRTFTQNGETWREIGFQDQIGAYVLYQVWYLSGSGQIQAHIFAKGLQCQTDHLHYPFWRLDFDLFGTGDDQIRRHTGTAWEVYSHEFDAAATAANNHQWQVRDAGNGMTVDIAFDTNTWNVPGTVIPESMYANNQVYGRLYQSSEAGDWTDGAITSVQGNNGENINGQDTVLWYRGYLPHLASEGGALWHSTGIRLTVNLPDEVEGEGLVGYWPLDTDGSAHVDGTDGVLQNGVSLVTDAERGAVLAFDGLDDYVSIPLDVPEAAGTISFWFKTTDEGRGLFSVVSGELGPRGHDRHLYLTTGNVGSRLWRNQIIHSSGQHYADGQWHQLVYTHGPTVGGQHLYVDGIKVASGTKASSDFTWQDRLHLGMSYDAVQHYFKGRMDDLRYFQRALTASEVQALWRAERPHGDEVASEDLVGYWPLDTDGRAHVGGTDGVLQNGVSLVTDAARGAVLAFDGLDDYVSIPLDVPEAAGTISFWFKTTDEGRGLFSVASGELGPRGHDRHLYLTTGNVGSRLWRNQIIHSSGQHYADGQWHQLVYTHGPAVGGQHLYVDGIKVASGTKASSDFTWQDRLHLGMSYDAVQHYFKGRMDDLRYFQRALAASEVQALWRAERPHGDEVAGEDLVGYWPLDTDGSAHVGGTDGVLQNGVSLVTDAERGAVLAFDGLDDYVSIPLDVPEAAGTISFWFKTTDEGRGLFSVVSGELGPRGHDRHLYLTTGNVGSRLWRNQIIHSSGQHYADGQWHQLVYTHGPTVGGQHLYVDGIKVASGTKASSDFTWQDRVHLGHSWDAAHDYFKGRMDDLRYFQRALAASEVQALWQTEQP